MLELKALGPEQKDQLRSHWGKAMKGDNWGYAMEKGRQNAQERKLTEVGLGVGEKREPGAFSLGSHKTHDAVC